MLNCVKVFLLKENCKFSFIALFAFANCLPFGATAAKPPKAPLCKGGCHFDTKVAK